MTCHCPRDLTFSWQPYFDRHVFQKFRFLLLKQNILKKLSCSIFFKSLGRFMVFLFVLLLLSRFWTVFGGFGQIQKFKMADQGGCHSEMIMQLLCHVTS